MNENQPPFKWEERINPSVWILNKNQWEVVSICVRMNLDITPGSQIKAYLENDSQFPIYLKITELRSYRIINFLCN